MSTNLTAKTKALLLVTMEAPASFEEEFNDWYDFEHLPQRLAMPGFENGGRFVCLEGWPRWLALYDLSSRAALETLYTGDYRNTDIASRARSAAQQMDNARSALQSSLLLQAQNSGCCELLGDRPYLVDAVLVICCFIAGVAKAIAFIQQNLSFMRYQYRSVEFVLIGPGTQQFIQFSNILGEN